MGPPLVLVSSCFRETVVVTFKNGSLWLQDSFKRKSVFSFFHKKGDDIIFLQETHASISNETFWSSQWGGHCWFSSHASNSRGVGILIKANHKISVNSVDKDPDGRFLVLDIIINNFHVILVNVYGPNKDDPDFYFKLFSRWII